MGYRLGIDVGITFTDLGTDSAGSPSSCSRSALAAYPADRSGTGAMVTRECDRALVASEVRRRLVTAERVRAYGIVGRDGAIDDAAAKALRATSLAGRAGALPLFDFGPGIERRRAVRKAKTGFLAPLQPEWHPVVAAG